MYSIFNNVLFYNCIVLLIKDDLILKYRKGKKKNQKKKFNLNSLEGAAGC